MCITEDAAAGHWKVMHWTMACLVLHNILASIQIEDDDIRLEENEDLGRQEEEDRAEVQTREPETEGAAKRAGVRRREELVEMVALKRR